jgi:predicted RNase H-like nuclease (RuvC/YqgF family)
MILELNDNDMLNLLMTSEFEDDYTPIEFKYLLKKWKYFYRLQQGKYERDKTELEGDIRSIEDKIKSLEYKIFNLQSELLQKQNLINNIKRKKLTWRERFSGKINIDNINE